MSTSRPGHSRFWAGAARAACGYRSDRAGMHQHAALRACAARGARLPVFDIYSLITWFRTGLRPREFAR